MNFIKQLNKKAALRTLWSGVALSWLVLGVTFFITNNDTTAIVAVTAAAVIAECAVWASALLLGIAMVDARKTLWNKLFARTQLQ
jgi:hypothetical protein